MPESHPTVEGETQRRAKDHKYQYADDFLAESFRFECTRNAHVGVDKVFERSSSSFSEKSQRFLYPATKNYYRGLTFVQKIEPSVEVNPNSKNRRYLPTSYLSAFWLLLYVLVVGRHYGSPRWGLG